ITERKLAQNKLQESEEKFRKAFQTSPDSININRLEDGTYVSINKGFTQIMGYSENDVLGKTSLDLQIWESPEDRKKLVDGLKESGQVNNLEACFKAKNGDILYGLMSAAVLDLNGVPHIISITRDITERKQAEKRLIESEERFHGIFEGVQDAIFVEDLDYKILDVNQRACEIFGYSREQFKTMTVRDLIPSKEYFVGFDENELEGTGVGPTETVNVRANGERFPVEISARLSKLGGQRVILLILRDITERMRDEEKILRLNRLYATLSEINQTIVRVHDRDTLFQEICQVAVERAKFRMAWIGLLDDGNGFVKPVFFAGEEQGYLENIAIKYQDEELGRGPTGSAAREERCIVCQDIATDPRMKPWREQALQRGYRSSAAVPFRQGGRVVGALTVYAPEPHSFDEDDEKLLDEIGQDISFALDTLQAEMQRTLAEETARKASLYNRSLIEASLDPLVTIGPDGKIMDVNAATMKATGFKRKELLGTDFSNYFTEPGKARSGYQEVFQKGAVRNYPLELKHRDGHLTPVSYNAVVYYDADGDLIGVFAAARDITERKNAEEALRMRLAELELIYQSGLELSQILEPEQIAQKMIDQLEKQLNWHHTAIRLYDAESQTLKIVGFNAPNTSEAVERQGLEGHFNSLVQKPGDGLTGWVVQHDQALRIGDLKLDSRYIETFPGLNSGLYVPIKIESRIIGVISVENELPDAFNESDERLVRTLASQAAIAFENSRLHKETVRQLHQLQALHSIDLAITNSLDLNITIEVLINQAVQQLGLDAAAIFVLQSDVNSLKYLSSKGFRAHLLETASQDLLLNESFAGRAIYGRRAIESPASQEPKEELREIWMTEGFHTVYAIPLLTKGESKGVIEVFYRSENKRPTKIQKDFLETLASQAAIAIENIHLFEGLHRSNMELAIAYDATIEGWSRAMDLRDKETEGHTKRVVEMALELAADFGFSGDMLTQIRRGALLHDIGKLGVPDSILFKPDKLSDEEWTVMKKHPTFAFEMLSPIQYLSRALNIPYCHHEKWDGSGYPRGLSAEQIPLEARIFAVVDVWDALTSDRPYRKAWTKPKTIKYIESLAGAHFDPAVVERFLSFQKKRNLT
ncbi:MAG TPA: PAS domain S-box protein, partial [Anaerolineales bacterium]